MKRPVLKLSAPGALGLLAALCWWSGGVIAVVDAQEQEPGQGQGSGAASPAAVEAATPPAAETSPAAAAAASASPAGKTKAKNKGKAKPDTSPGADEPRPPSKDKSKNKPASKEIPIILPIGESAKDITIPQNSITGALLSRLAALKMTRIDDGHMQVEGMKMDLYQPDGKTDFFIDIPTSIFDLKTRIIHSEHPVTIRTKDFELTGERMEFDTVERTGKLLGRVEMRVHNLKQVAGEDDDNPKNE